MEETTATVTPDGSDSGRRRDLYGFAGILMTSLVFFVMIFLLMNPIFYVSIIFLWGLSLGDVDSWLLTCAYGIGLLSLWFMFFIGSVGIQRFIKVDKRAMTPVLIFLVLFTSRPLLHSFLTTVVLSQNSQIIPILTRFDNPLMTSGMSSTTYIIFLSVSALFLLIFLNLLRKNLKNINKPNKSN